MTAMISPNTSLAMMQATQGNASRTSGYAPNSKEYKKFDAAAREFESVFIGEMIKPMFEGISTEAPFGGGKGEEIFRGLLVNEYSKMLASSGGIGLSSQIREQMIAMQEQANNAKTAK